MNHLKTNQPEQQAENKNEKTNERLTRLGNVGNKFFHDERSESYVCVDYANSSKVMKVLGPGFSDLLLKKHFEETEEVPQPEALRQVISYFAAKAKFSGSKHSVNTRIGEHNGSFYYDLNIENGASVVELRAGSWGIIPTSPVYFSNPQNMAPQVIPSSQKGNVKLLLKHVRFKSKADKLLYLVYIISSFIQGIPHPILILSGEKGSAKSTSTRITRNIVDPAVNEITKMPSGLRDLAISLQNNYMSAYDNMTSIPGNISDFLCMAVTGAAFSTRKMYSDDDESMLSFKRCVILNGINVVASKADLLDRSIILELDRIDGQVRKAEKQVLKNFEDDKPAILGGIFDVLSKAIEIYPTIELTRLPRMADFALWGYAIAEALKKGWGNSFIKAYNNNIKRASDEAVSAHPVASALIAMMSRRNHWQGSVTNLLEDLEKVAYRERIDTRTKDWPRAPHALSRRINEIQSNLKQCGIRVTIRHCGDFKEATVENIKEQAQVLEQ